MKAAAFACVLALAALAFATPASVAGVCSIQPTCGDCVGDPFCGWCSPSPTVYSNGTLGTRCQNITAAGWHCNGVYSTQTCQQGYICNSTSGQCILAPPGQGDTLANCEAQCTITPPGPTNLSVCVIVTPTVQQCQPCQDYCTNDTQCPQSFCQGGLCHGSTCQQQQTCNEQCTSDTPATLQGIWRGVQIQTGYSQGEYDMQFQVMAAGPQVTFMDPTGLISTGSLQTDSQVPTNILLAFSTGPLANITLRGGYSPWQPSTVTEQQAFYFSPPNAAQAPATDMAAMAGNGATVYAMSRCNPQLPTCNFSSVFPVPSVSDATFEHHNARLLAARKAAADAAAAEALKKKMQQQQQQQVGGGPSSDPCQAFSTCSNCIAAASGLCGWCVGEVVYGNSTPGLTQCAGFDSSGVPLGWQCTGVFQKDTCADFGCDWTNPQAPTCAPCNNSATCTLTQDQCNTTCVTPPEIFTCDNTTSTCVACNVNYCTNDTQCPGSYCNIEGPGPWQCHGAVGPSDCGTQSACNASCSANQTQFYVCNPFAGTCQPTSNSTPGATTQYLCQHNCSTIAPLGTWRGVEVNQGFVAGEWDFTFYNDSTVHWRQPNGATFMAQLDGLNMSAGAENTIQVTGVIPGSPAQRIYAVFEIENEGNDMIVDMLFWGQSNTSMPADFPSAMVAGDTMFILNACRGSASNCDFSQSAVYPSADTQEVRAEWRSVANNNNKRAAAPLTKEQRFAQVLYAATKKK